MNFRVRQRALLTFGEQQSSWYVQNAFQSFGSEESEILLHFLSSSIKLSRAISLAGNIDRLYKDRSDFVEFSPPIVVHKQRSNYAATGNIVRVIF